MSRDDAANSGKITEVTTCGGTMDVNGKSMTFYSGAITGVKVGDSYEFTTVTQTTKGGETNSKILTTKSPRTDF